MKKSSLMNQLGFKNTLITVVIFMLLIGLGLTSYIALNHLKTKATHDFEYSLFNSLEYEVEKIQDYVSYRAQPIAEMAKLYEKYDYTVGHEKYLEFAAAVTPVSKFTLGFDDGSSFASRASKTFPNGIAITSKYDPRTRPWYKLGKSETQLTISDVFFTKSTNQPLVAVVHPVKDGVMMGDIRLAHLSTMLDSLKTTEGSTAFIIDHKGLVLASTSTYVEMSQKIQDAPAFSEVNDNILNQQQVITENKINGVDHLIVSKHFDLIGNAQWTMVITVDSKTAFTSVVEAFWKLATLVIGIAIVFALLLTFILYRIYQPVIALRKIVTGLSKGDADLTQRLEVKTDDDLGQIAKGINDFIQLLQNMMLDILNSSDNISKEISQLKQVSESNEEALTSHASETEQAVTAITQMSASANAVADSAQQTALNTKQASDEALSSKELVTASSESVRLLVSQVDSAATCINTMNDNTQEIVSVLSVIGAIADQTNLLALNAAIEAARAGEFGRGFAVVADEVRSLAARTQSSTAEINELLSKLTSDATLAVNAMDTTKESCQVTTDNTIRVGSGLDTMAGSIIEINELSTHIANASIEQSGVAEEINRNMSSIQEMVNDLTENGAHTAVSTEKLLKANNQLAQLVSSFKLS